MQKVSQYSPIIWKCKHPLTVTIYGTQAEWGIAERGGRGGIGQHSIILFFYRTVCHMQLPNQGFRRSVMSTDKWDTPHAEGRASTSKPLTDDWRTNSIGWSYYSTARKICALARSTATGPPSKSSFISATLILRDSRNLQSHCVFKKIWDKDGREPSTRQTCVLPDWKNWNPTMYKTLISHWN